MNDLFKKLNTLVRANVNHVLDDAMSAVRGLAPARAAQDLDVQVRTLRASINDALDHEDVLVAQAAQLSDEVARWDAEADAAVARGDDEQARWCIGQMQRTQHLLGFAEADLRAHRHVTQELIVRVNQLEASVADVRAQREGSAPPPTPTRSVPPRPEARAPETPRRVEDAAARLAVPRSEVPAPTPQPPLAPPTPAPMPQPEQPPLAPPTPSPLPLPEQPPLAPPAPSPLPLPEQPPVGAHDDAVEDAAATALPAAAYVPAQTTPAPAVPTPLPPPDPVAAVVAEVEALRDESRVLARTTLDDVQQRIAQMNAMLAARAAQQNPDVQAQVREAVDDAKVEDDLHKRRSRLSKP